MLTRMPPNQAEKSSNSLLHAEKIISEVVIPILSQVSSNKEQAEPIKSQKEESSFKYR
ncbi:Uncharacterised protein [Legionella sainthelensi]|nr:Uncharacterised protein [Legionella sainthelensi]